MQKADVWKMQRLERYIPRALMNSATRDEALPREVMTLTLSFRGLYTNNETKEVLASV